MTAYQQVWNQQPQQMMQPQVYPPQPYQPRFVPQATQMQMQQPQQSQQMMQPQPQQFPQMSQNTNQSVQIYGRYVTNPKDISAGEVPMDKNYYFFPTFDMSTIYAKYWDDNGTLQTNTYVYQQNETVPQQQQQDFNAVIIERLDKIEEMLTNRTNGYYKKNNYRKADKNTEQVKEQNNAVSNTDA